MGFISLIRTAAGRMAVKLDALRITGGSNSLNLLVYDSSENAYIPTNPSAINVHTPGYSGDGRDGAVHYTTNTTLTQDIRATTLLVDVGVSLNVAGFEISATTSITNNGTIHDNGANASGATPGTNRDPTTCSVALAGGDGGARTAAGGVTKTSPVLGGGLLTPEPFGASGGAGAGTGHGAGGNNSTSFTFDVNVRSPFSGPSPMSIGLILGSAGQFEVVTLGCGGGGGNASTGGTGGGGGGVVRLGSPLIINNGTISAKGGNGSAGTASGGSGGGGGGGGRIIIVGNLTVAGTLNVSGGTGGAGNGSGTAGTNGQAGSVHLFN